MEIQRVTRRSVADDVFEQLLGAVVAGDVDSGEGLPSERVLAERFGVNRQAIREAVQRLSQAGVVEVRHGGTTMVRDLRRNAGLDLLPRLLVRRDGTVDVAVVRSVMELRAALGPDAARRCAERATSDAVESLAEVVDRMAAAGDDLPALAVFDLELWEIVVEASDNLAYALAFNSLRRAYEPVMDLLRQVMADELRDLEARRALAAAVRAGDGDAAEAAVRRFLAHGTAGMTAALAAAAAAETEKLA